MSQQMPDEAGWKETVYEPGKSLISPRKEFLQSRPDDLLDRFLTGRSSGTHAES